MAYPIYIWHQQKQKTNRFLFQIQCKVWEYMVQLAERSELDHKEVTPVSRILLSPFMEVLLTKHLEQHCDTNGDLYILTKPSKKAKTPTNTYKVREKCTVAELLRGQDKKVLKQFKCDWGKTVVKGTFVPNKSFEKKSLPDTVRYPGSPFPPNCEF